MEHNVDENIQMEEFSDEPDIVWTGIGKKIPVVIFYASLLESELKERFLPSGSFRLTYKTGKTDCKIVRSILQAHGFMEVHPGSSYFNLYWTGSHVKPYDLRCYGEYQKVNHFPRSYEITRKDRLGKNIQRMQQTKGFKSFNFIPKTYVIPEEFHQFVVTFTKEQGVWIVKPIASSRGRGIFLVNHPSQIPTEDPMVVSRYVDNPLCIDGFKFDVRLYVAVTSYYPLRIFLYEEGLTRFATVRYNGTGRNLHNQRMHLTNYSINKKSMEYVRCEDPTIEDYGNKWSMSAMLRYLEEEGKDVATLVSRVEDVIIKTIISGELPIAGACKAFMSQRTNCFEIYGFDILIDKNLYPWLLEVNLSPSLACDAPLDFRIKSNLVADLFSLVGIVVQDPYSGEVKRRQKDSVAECKQRVKPFLSSSTDVSKLNYTAESMHAVRETKEEFARRGKFVRIFPRVDTWDLYGGYLEHKAVNYTLHCQLFPDRVRSRTMSAPKERIRSSQSREQVSLPEVNIAALQKRVDQYKRVLTTKQKQQEAIPLQAVISKRPSYTGMEGVTAATVHRPVISSSEKRAGTVAAENDQAKIDSEVISQSVVKRPLVSEPCDRINPEMLSKIQARHVFAAYLEHVQRRLIKETSYTDVKEKGKFSNESDQADIDLIVKFLKKAASNLRGSFQVIEPSLAIPVRDRCRILAKQLAEFITLYRKETVQYEHREKMYGVYVMKDTKQEGVSDDQFCLFLKQTKTYMQNTLIEQSLLPSCSGDHGPKHRLYE
ncbi:tubulin polyglutamylase TTLL5-like isoform X2 [Dysidea avara]|uniref:tubulin polyglutamylase TTLL5-like isoform X2 n=1 Tax=Dysidea avara TaxID=196820 RepID=UPI003321116A